MKEGDYNMNNINSNDLYEANPGAAYGEHIKNTGVVCNSSISHTYGNVLSVVEQFLLHQFPDNVFKTVMGSSSIVSHQVTHLPRQLHKKPTPMMILAPRIVFGQDDNRFLSHTLINERRTNTHNLWGQGSMMELAKDRKRKLYVHGQYNRAVMYVDVVLSFDTYNQQLDYMNHIHNMIPVNHNQFLTAPLELYIPQGLCDIISTLSNTPITDDNHGTLDFTRYMNTIWHKPITYKLKGSTNKNEFFMYYLADIDLVIQEPTAGPGVKDGQIKRNFDITFTVRTEFNTIGYFTMNSPSLNKVEYLPNEENQVTAPIFSDMVNLNDYSVPLGWQILGWPIFKLKSGENKISINPSLNMSLNAVIDYHLDHNITMDTFIRIEFRENGRILNNEMFFIDWKSREIVITNPNVYRTYRLIITVSPNYINELVKEITGLE